MKPSESIADILCSLFYSYVVRSFVASKHSGVGPDSTEMRPNAADLEDRAEGSLTAPKTARIPGRNKLTAPQTARIHGKDLLS
jgi:hypothetical protein